MADTPKIDLKAAVSFVDEVFDALEPLKQAIQQAPSVLDASFWDGLKARGAISRESGQLLGKCDQAIALASRAKEKAPDLTVTKNIEGSEFQVGADFVIAHAYLGKGMVYFLANQLDKADVALKQSMNAYPNPLALVRVSLVKLEQGFLHEALVPLRKAIEDFPESEEAVEARKLLSELEYVKPKNWSTALILSILTGILGIDRFYMGYVGLGLLKMFTAGGFYVWWLIDIVRIATNTLRDARGLKLQK